MPIVTGSLKSFLQLLSAVMCLRLLCAWSYLKSLLERKEGKCIEGDKDLVMPEVTCTHFKRALYHAPCLS